MQIIELCLFCDAVMDEYQINPNYMRCPACNTLHAKSLPDLSMYKTGEFRQFYEKVLVERTNGDVGHYNRLVGQKEFTDALQHLSINTMYAFGGGFPKLESYFSPNKIVVYDMMADLYITHMEMFRNLFQNAPNDIEVKDEIITPALIESIDFSNNDAITFIHFLEHLTPKEIKSLLISIPKDIVIIIYQPEITTIRNSQWWHFDPQHITLVGVDNFIQIIKQWFDIEIITNWKYSDDFMLIFKKV
jgi:hypothetical protein